jgi:hypothetical protein
MIEDTTMHDEISENDDGHINLAPPAEFSGHISESFWRQLQTGPLRLSGVDTFGRESEFQFELSGKFINAAIVCFGAVSSRYGCVAVKIDNGEWHYTKAWRHDLELASSQKKIDTIFAKVHLYFRT